MKRFTAAGCTLAVLVVCMLAREAEAGVKIVLGGVDGWTNKANIDYDKWLSNYNVKVGDTVLFENYDTTDHTVVRVNKLAYETCGSSGKMATPLTIAPRISYSVTFLKSGPVYFICDITTHCIEGQKVFVEVLNTDGTVNTTAAATPGKSGAPAMPGFNWTSQLMIVVVASFSLMVAAATM